MLRRQHGCQLLLVPLPLLLLDQRHVERRGLAQEALRPDEVAVADAVQQRVNDLRAGPVPQGLALALVGRGREAHDGRPTLLVPPQHLLHAGRHAHMALVHQHERHALVRRRLVPPAGEQAVSGGDDHPPPQPLDALGVVSALLDVALLAKPKFKTVASLTHEVDERHHEHRVSGDAGQFRHHLRLARADRLADDDPLLALAGGVAHGSDSSLLVVTKGNSHP